MKYTPYLSIVLCYFFSFSCFAQPGTFDTTFNFDGIATANIGYYDYGQAIALQADGKIVVAGYSTITEHDISLTRFNSDGSLDQDFGEGGTVSTVVMGEERAYAVCLQDDGKIVVAGHTGSNYGGLLFATLRYNTDGSLDNTFSSDGMDTTDFGYGNCYARSVHVREGKILVTGSAKKGDNMRFALLQYLSDGTPDESLADGGIKTYTYGEGDYYCTTSVLDEDGRIIMAGYVDDGESRDFAVSRINQWGYYDMSFGTNGHTITSVNMEDDQCYDVVLQADGKIVSVGSSRVEGISNSTLVRYSPDGEIDLSFGLQGIVISSLSNYHDALHSVKVQQDGKIVAGGYAWHSAYDMAIARYNTDGSFDNSFGQAGNGYYLHHSAYDDQAFAVAIQDDNKILLAGYSRFESYNTDFTVCRFNSGLPTSILSNEITSNFKLEVFPNPIKMNGHIRLRLPEKSEVTLKLLNINGVVVKVFLNAEKMDSGISSIEFSLNPNLVQGCYFLLYSDGVGNTNLTKILKH